jgi:hypothetical protein
LGGAGEGGAWDFWVAGGTEGAGECDAWAEGEDDAGLRVL